MKSDVAEQLEILDAEYRAERYNALQDFLDELNSIDSSYVLRRNDIINPPPPRIVSPLMAALEESGLAQLEKLLLQGD